MESIRIVLDTIGYYSDSMNSLKFKALFKAKAGFLDQVGGIENDNHSTGERMANSRDSAGNRQLTKLMKKRGTR